MNPAVEQLSDDKVKLTVDVPAHDVHHAVEHAANDLAATVRIPGFRKGKVPRPILMQRVGKERLYSEAVESHIGGWFWNAATRARVNPIAQPEYEYELPASESEDWSFSATVEVQPKPEPADWTQLQVPKHEAEVPAEAVQAELEALQKTVGELVPVEGRPAEDGDTAIVDLISEDGSAQRDYVVDLGSERLVEEIENGIRGRELVAQKITGDARNDVRWKEVADGKLFMPREPRTLYVLTGTGFDAASGKVIDAYLRWVVYIPYATPESTGLSTKASDSAPWLMSPGTAGAHIMINPPKNNPPKK